MIAILLVSAALTAQTAVTDDLALLEKAYAARNTPQAGEFRQQVEAKLPEMDAAFASLISAGRGNDALRFAIPYAYFLRTGNHMREALDVLTRALDAPGARAASPQREGALYDAGVLAFRLNDESKSRAFNKEDVRIARQLNDRAAEAAALIGLSRLALRHHDYKNVIAEANRAADLRREAGDPAGAISAMHMVAAAEKMSGADQRAQQIYESTLASYQSSGDVLSAAGERYNLGFVHLHLGHVQQAKELFTAALDEYAKQKQDLYIAFCLTGLAAVAAVEQQGTRAAQLYGSAAATLQRLGVTLDPDDQLDWDRYTAIARRELKTQYDPEFQRGRRLTMADAISLAKQ